MINKDWFERMLRLNMLLSILAELHFSLRFLRCAFSPFLVHADTRVDTALQDEFFTLNVHLLSNLGC